MGLSPASASRDRANTNVPPVFGVPAACEPVAVPPVVLLDLLLPPHAASINAAISATAAAP
jgi:hypothetical protein